MAETAAAVSNAAMSSETTIDSDASVASFRRQSPGIARRSGRETAAAPATVLFVSDDDYFRSTMLAYLEHVGYQVRSCADAARVPELFFHGSGNPSGSGASFCFDVDLLLIDVDALGAPGLRMAAELTSFDPDLPVIAIAAPHALQMNGLAGSVRGWKYVSKPVLLPELLELIRAALEPQARTDAEAGTKGVKTQLRLLKAQGTLP